MFCCRYADIFIGGHASHLSPATVFRASRIYATDSLTPCIRHAGIRPIWQNIFAICTTINVILAGFATYYATVIILYMQAPFERWLRADAYTIMLDTLQHLLNQSPRLQPKLTVTRLFFTFIMWGFVLFYTSVMSFYFVVIQKSIPLYQIHTKGELIEANFRIVGNLDTLKMIEKDAIVSHYFIVRLSQIFICIFSFFFAVSKRYDHPVQ